MNGNDDNTPAPRATPVDPGTTVERATPPPAAPGVQRAVQVSDPSPLASSRVPFAQELQNNPNLMLRLTNSVYNEVGTQSPNRWRAYLESVMNRGVANNQSLDKIISNIHYYPPTTTDHLDDPLSKETQGFQSRLSPILNSVLGGSNVSSFATGNQGVDPKTGKYITSGGATVTLPHEKYPEDDFVIEKGTEPWVAGMSNKEGTFQWSKAPGGAPTPWTAPAGPAGSPGAHGSPPAPQTPEADETDDDTGYGQSFGRYLGGHLGAINA